MSYKLRIRMIQAKFKGCPKFIEEMIKDTQKPPRTKAGYWLRCIYNLFTK